jgi:hypothetical protein
MSGAPVVSKTLKMDLRINIKRVRAFERTYGTNGRSKASKGKTHERDRDGISSVGPRGEKRR